MELGYYLFISDMYLLTWANRQQPLDIKGKTLFMMMVSITVRRSHFKDNIHDLGQFCKMVERLDIL